MALKTKPKETTLYKYDDFILGDMKRRALYCTYIFASIFMVNPEDGVSIYLQNISSTAPCPHTVASLEQN
jgi:hypothetical protein